MSNVWPLSRSLLIEVLADHTSDRFLTILIWERLGYKPLAVDSTNWTATEKTPSYWVEKFPEAPEVISERMASVHLTRSIPKENKQALKKILNFQGYRIGELYPRRTRRATAVNWLLSWCLINQIDLPEKGPLPTLFLRPEDPSFGHPGDLQIN